jgi:tetratricopeptide (TPR) repeat protein
MMKHLTAASAAVTLALVLPATASAQEKATKPSAAQQQLRRSALEAWDKREPREVIELLQGYLQIGETSIAWTELARAQMSLGQCPDTREALDRAAAAPLSTEASAQEVQTLRDQVEEQYTLRCTNAASPEQLYQLGLNNFQERRWLEAAQAFGLAFAQDPDPTLAYNVARSYEYAGDLDQAEAFYNKALELGPEPDLERKVRDTLERLGNIRADLGAGGREPKEGLGLLEVRTEPAGAIVRVDGKVVGETPLSTAWPAGELSLVITREGFQEVRKRYTLEPGKEVVLDTRLDSAHRFWTWIVLGGAASFAGSGVGFGLAAQEKLEDAKGAESLRDEALFQDLKDEGETYAWLSLGSYTLAGLALGGAVVLYFVEDPTRSSEPAPQGEALRWFVTPTSVGVWGSF